MPACTLTCELRRHQEREILQPSSKTGIEARAAVHELINPSAQPPWPSNPSQAKRPKSKRKKPGEAALRVRTVAPKYLVSIEHLAVCSGPLLTDQQFLTITHLLPS